MISQDGRVGGIREEVGDPQSDQGEAGSVGEIGRLGHWRGQAASLGGSGGSVGLMWSVRGIGKLRGAGGIHRRDGGKEVYMGGIRRIRGAGSIGRKDQEGKAESAERVGGIVRESRVQSGGWGEGRVGGAGRERFQEGLTRSEGLTVSVEARDLGGGGFSTPPPHGTKSYF